MKNSLVPIASLALLLLSLPLCIARGDGGGTYGPQIEAGIYRGHEAQQVATLDDLRLSITALPGEGPMRHDGRLGLEVVPWSETVLVADDDTPLTRAVIKALAEILSSDAQGEYQLLLIAPSGQDALPVPALRCLRVATQAASLPARPGAPFSARLALVVEDARDQSAPLRRQVGVIEEALVLQVEAAQQALASADWPRWYASVGRALATETLQHFRGAQPELAWDDPGFRARHDDWGDAVPITPRHQTLRWQAAWQDPLVRGWSGLIYGKRYLDRRSRQTGIAEDFERMLSRGGWARDPDPLDAAIAWRFPRDQGLDRFALHEKEWGFTVSGLDVRADSEAVIEGWIAAGDRRQLRQHLNAPGLETGLRTRMAAALREQADLAERVLLAEREDVPAAWKQEAQWVAWLRGLGERPAGTLPPLTRAEWDGGHRLGLVGEVATVLVVSRQEPLRRQLWYRLADGDPQRVEVVDGQATIGTVHLRLDQGSISGD